MYKVYVITSKLDGRQYVGQTTTENLQVRLSLHHSNARYQARYRPVNGLWAAMLGTEKSDWTIQLLQECETKAEASRVEALMIDQLGTFTPGGLNLTVHGGPKKRPGPARRLTAQQAEEIRRRYQPRVTPYIKLAAEYGVSEPAVIAVVKGRNWKRPNLNTQDES